MQTAFVPDTVTVHPTAVLVLHYFQNKFVYGDNPFTQEIEPSIPFNLFIVIQNIGNGIAQQLQIASGQPKIIENKKDLLVSFQIIGTEMGLEKLNYSSLTVNFGDIKSHQIVVGRWILLCSLWGQFLNYTATYVNKNPLGDQSLSLMPTLTYHELIQVVKTNDVSYAQGDMLINDVPDALGIPDTVYNVTDGKYYPVDYVNTTIVKIDSFNLGNRIYQMLNTSTNAEHAPPLADNQSTWITIMLPWPDSIKKGFQLLEVWKVDGPKLAQENFWETNSIIFERGHWLSLFDSYYKGIVAENIEYGFVLGLPNLYAPEIDASSLEIFVPQSANAPGKVIGQLNATDADGDRIRYSVRSNTVVSIDSETGVITLTKRLENDVESVQVQAWDLAIPSQETEAVLKIILEILTTSASTTTLSTKATTESKTTFGSPTTSLFVQTSLPSISTTNTNTNINTSAVQSTSK